MYASRATSATLHPRLRACLPEKGVVLLGLTVGICLPYFALQQVSLFPARRAPVSSLDLAIHFSPEWIWPYVSIAVLVPLAPLLAASREQLRRYAWGLLLLCLPCFATFLLMPVVGPRPVEGVVSDGLYALIVSVDRPSNSLPSLHAGLALYSLLFAWRVGARPLDSAWRLAFGLGGVLWAGLILYSTLATKQHWVVDLPAGMLLALAAHRLAWRGGQLEPALACSGASASPSARTARAKPAGEPR